MNSQHHLHIEYNSEFYEEIVFQECIRELRNFGIEVSMNDNSDVCVSCCGNFHSSIAIEILHELFKTVILSGCYDVFKVIVKNLWSSIFNQRKEYQEPFTISIENIPTINGPENIRCKINGDINSEQKSDAIDKVFELAMMIEENEYKLKAGSHKYKGANGHVFRYYSKDGNIYEVTDEEYFCGYPEDLL